MNLLIIGSTFDVIGKVLIGIAVLFVHKHILIKHNIDKSVLLRMKKEQLIGGFGILFVIIGYIIHLFSYRGIF